MEDVPSLGPNSKTADRPARLARFPIHLGVTQALNIAHHPQLEALEVLPRQRVERELFELPDDRRRRWS
nr:hypothetical protein [Arthrobacter terrae]